MYITDDLSRPFPPPNVYSVKKDDIERLRLELHKRVDNLINAHKRKMSGEINPKVEIFKKELEELRSKNA